MKKGIKIGFWYSPSEPNYPTPKENKELYISVIDKNKVINYLERKEFNYTMYKGYSLCRICGCVNGSIDRTDGKFIWPVGLTHYVQKHNVELPMEFYEHIKAFQE